MKKLSEVSKQDKTGMGLMLLKWHLCITTLGPLLHPQTLSPSSIFYLHPSIASQSQE